MLEMSSCRAIIYRQDGSALDVSPYLSLYNEASSVNSFATFSLMLPAKIGKDKTLELIQKGDLLEVGFRTNTPKGFPKFNTTMIGVVRLRERHAMLVNDTLQRYVMISGSSLAGLMVAETISWYQFWGSIAGALKTLGVVPLDLTAMVSIDEALDVLFQAYALKVLRYKHALGGVADLLGFDFTTIPAIGIFQEMFATFEGSLWGLLEIMAERPVHEVFATVWPLERFKGNYSKPAKTFGEDNMSTAVVVRPSPFPFVENGVTVFKDWEALTLHDLTKEDVDQIPEGQTLRDSDDKVVSFTMILPKAFNLDEVDAVHWAPPIVNDELWQRYGYKPLQWQTVLWGVDAAKEDAPEFFRRLNYRIASQHNRADEFLSGSVPLKLSPHIRIGERVTLQDAFDFQGKYQFYVSAVNHTYAPDGNKKTTLSLERGLPEENYKDGAFWSKGLSELPMIGDAGRAKEIRSYDAPGPTGLQRNAPPPGPQSE